MSAGQPLETSRALVSGRTELGVIDVVSCYNRADIWNPPSRRDVHVVHDVHDGDVLAGVRRPEGVH